MQCVSLGNIAACVRMVSIVAVSTRSFTAFSVAPTTHCAGTMSRMDSCTVFGRDMYIKRDDLIATQNSMFNGNKARKLMSYVQNLPKEQCYLSIGGAQSNSMLAIARLSQAQGKRFIYFTRTVPVVLKLNPIGNYKEALATHKTQVNFV